MSVSSSKTGDFTMRQRLFLTLTWQDLLWGSNAPKEKKASIFVLLSSGNRDAEEEEEEDGLKIALRAAAKDDDGFLEEEEDAIELMSRRERHKMGRIQ
ncbi:hypothetical protein Bca52824_028373 [Brassica carinata]|uniref:Uncharacterized protein n=1 Tax=Brassica carinata TaxID=52824 RepID=A0A8X7VCM4_BRACI|nr:hypothetical protein Bca52824_028373 [Brassica carinata]